MPQLVRLAGLRVQARVGAREIEICHAGKLVARHERMQGRLRVSASLDHYLELLARKPGALRGSLALAQERERGAWPSCLDELWGKIAERYGASEAARQMVDVLMLARERSPAELELAVRGALGAGAHDTRDQQTPTAYLAALLEAEVQERSERRERRRLVEARFPLMKRLEDFRFDDNPKISQATVATLAQASSPAMHAPSSSCLTSSAIWLCPRAPPSSSSR